MPNTKRKGRVARRIKNYDTIDRYISHMSELSNITSPIPPTPSCWRCGFERMAVCHSYNFFTHSYYIRIHGTHYQAYYICVCEPNIIVCAYLRANIRHVWDSLFAFHTLCAFNMQKNTHTHTYAHNCAKQTHLFFRRST